MTALGTSLAAEAVSVDKKRFLLYIGPNALGDVQEGRERIICQNLHLCFLPPDLIRYPWGTSYSKSRSTMIPRPGGRGDTACVSVRRGADNESNVVCALMRTWNQR